MSSAVQTRRRAVTSLMPGAKRRRIAEYRNTASQPGHCAHAESDILDLADGKPVFPAAEMAAWHPRPNVPRYAGTWAEPDCARVPPP